jgi:hypothetical protein
LKALDVEADLITLVSELEKRKQLEAAGGYAYAAALINTVASTANMPFYETEVLTAYRGRAAEMETVTGNSAAAEGGILFSDLLKKQFPPEDWLVGGFFYLPTPFAIMIVRHSMVN